MNNVLKKAFRVSALVLGAMVLLAFAFVLLLFLDKPLARNILEAQLARKTGMTVRLGRLDYSFFPFQFAVDSLEFTDETPFWKRSLTLAHIGGKGDVWKFVQSDKPAVDSIEIRGLVFRLDQKASSAEPVDIEALVGQVADVLSWTKEISVPDAQISLSLRDGNIGLDFFDVSLTMNGAERVGISIGRGEINAGKAKGHFVATSGLSVSGTLGLDPPFRFEASSVFSSVRLASGGAENTLPAAAIELSGGYDVSGRTLMIPRMKISVPDFFEIEGVLLARFGQDAFIKAETRAQTINLEAAARVIRPWLPPEFHMAGLRGRAGFSGEYVFRRPSGEPTDALTGSLDFENVEFDPVLGGLPVHLRAAGRIDVSGPLRDPRFTFDVRSSIGTIARAGLAVASSDVCLVGSAGRANAEISRFEARLNKLSYESSGGDKASCGKAVLAGKGSCDFLSHSAGLASFEATLTDAKASDEGSRGIAFHQAILKGRGNIDLRRKAAALAWGEAMLTDLDISMAEGRTISLDQAAFSGKGSLDLAGKSAEWSSLEVRIPGLAPLQVSGDIGLGEPGAAGVQLNGRGLDLAALRDVAAPFFPKSFFEWVLVGAADLSLTARRPAASNDGWSFSGTASLAGVGFNDPSFSIAGEGLAPVIKFEGVLPVSNPPSFSASLEMDKGEFLWKSAYISWSKHPLKLTCGGRFDSHDGSLDDLAVRVFAPTIGEIGVLGSAKIGPIPSFDFRTEARLNLGPLFSLQSSAGVSGENKMNLEGTFAASLLIRKDGDAFSLGGRLKIAETKMEWPATDTVLLGIAADVPVRYESGKNNVFPPDAPLPEEGFIRMEEFRNPFLTLKSLNFPLQAGVNAYAIEPVTLDFFGGKIDLGRTVFRMDPSTGSFQGNGSLALRDMDISTFPVRSPGFNLSGKIRAEFPRLEISPREIAVSGRGEADVFGGKIVLRDFAVSDPFDPGRAISLNVDLVDLDLKKLTDEIPFGEVTGVLRGQIRGLVIRYRQPERFDLQIESVPRKGISQTFSLKAVDNLTVLSSGQPASLGTGQFWMRYVRGFRYKKLGIISTLRNDTFTLSGMIQARGLEYFVKKPALFGINVINRMPGKKISFKEMVNRLERIEQSQK